LVGDIYRYRFRIVLKAVAATWWDRRKNKLIIQQRIDEDRFAPSSARFGIVTRRQYKLPLGLGIDVALSFVFTSLDF
jgi:hypothetical protein